MSGLWGCEGGLASRLDQFPQPPVYSETMARPNVILIMADQHRWDCTGYAGNPDLRTPNLDALAAHGVSFPQTICQCPQDVTSRNTLLSGQYPATHGVWSDDAEFSAGTPTLPAVLHDAGYNTAHIGKMHGLGTQTSRSFDVVRLAEQGGRAGYTDDYHLWLRQQQAIDQVDAWETMEATNLPGNYKNAFGAVPSNLPESLHSTTWIGDISVRFLQSAREPFFLSMGFIKPHPPHDPPAPWNRLYKQSALTLPKDWRHPVQEEDAQFSGLFDPRKMTEPKFRRLLAYYYALLSHIDEQIGRLLATLTSRGFTNNIFVYSANRGSLMGQHGLVLQDSPRLYEALIRVPLVIAGLMGQRRKKTDGALAQLTDIMPTILEAADIPIPDSVEGKSLVPQLHRANKPLRSEAYCERHEEIRLARGKRYKFVDATDDHLKAFHDLKKDPYEYRNLAGHSSVSSKQAELSRALELFTTRAARQRVKSRK